MTPEQLAAELDQPLWKIKKALKSLEEKGLVESKDTLAKEAYIETVRNNMLKQYLDSIEIQSQEQKLQAISAFCSGWEAARQFMKVIDNSNHQP